MISGVKMKIGVSLVGGVNVQIINLRIPASIRYLFTLPGRGCLLQHIPDSVPLVNWFLFLITIDNHK